MNVAEIIKRTRESRGLTRVDLAERSGLSSVAIGKIENGRVSPRLDTLEKISHALGYKSAKYLLNSQ